MERRFRASKIGKPWKKINFHPSWGTGMKQLGRVNRDVMKGAFGSGCDSICKQYGKEVGDRREICEWFASRD